MKTIPNDILLYSLTDALPRCYQKVFLWQQTGADAETHNQTLCTHTQRESKFEVSIELLTSEIGELQRGARKTESQREWSSSRDYDPLNQLNRVRM